MLNSVELMALKPFNPKTMFPSEVISMGDVTDTVQLIQLDSPGVTVDLISIVVPPSGPATTKALKI